MGMSPSRRVLIDVDTAWSRKWARPVRDSTGVYTWRATRRATEVAAGLRSDHGPDHQGAGRRRRGVPRADRAVPSRATGALLPDARILAGRRGRPAGDATGGLARPRTI